MKNKNRIKPTITSTRDIPPDALIEALKRQNRPMRIDGLLKTLGLPRQAKKNLLAILGDLEAAGRLTRFHSGLWSLPENHARITGRYHARANGGIVIPSESAGQKEIYIHPLQTAEAWENDLVSVALIPGKGKKHGKIIEILERPTKDVIARVEGRQGNFVICRPLDRRIGASFSLRADTGQSLLKSLEPGHILTIRRGERLARDLWSATLVNIHGAEDEIATQEAIVKRNGHVPDKFPALAMAQAEQAARPLAPEDLEDREDWRHLPFVTIDGADARDFDDAIHVQKTDMGWILRVAIADVSSYVAPDKNPESLDAEALRRGNSWYFPRSVEPMLPKILCNGMCSLRPGEDRLAMLVELPFTQKGNPLQPRFAPIVMRSAARLIYDDVADFFRSGQNQDRATNIPCAVDEKLRPMLLDAFRLYENLARKRRERGTLDFDLPEPAYVFDGDGKLEKVMIAARNDAHRLVEEFMIAANEAVARHLGKSGIPFLYRVHPKPEAAKLENLWNTLAETAVENLPAGLKLMDMAQPRVIQAILGKAKGTAQEYVVNRLCLRAMPQARYQPENKGHFGLASEAYCHFTSPIRRYADLLTHRALKKSLGIREAIPENFDRLCEIGERLNKLERDAMECEREMARRLGCLALKDREGETFRGTISGVTDFGAFVEFADMPIEGLMRMESLGDEWFELDQKRQRLIGARSGKTWSLGQSVEIRLKRVDLDRLELRLEPAAGNAPGKTRKTSARGHGNRNAPLPGRERSTRRDKRQSAHSGRRPGKSR